MKPVLRITTKLIKTEFDKGIKEMEGEAAGVSEALNGGSTATEGMAAALKSSAGSLVKLALIIGAIILAVKLIVDAVKNLAENNEEISNKLKAIGAALSNLWQGIITAVASLIKPAVEWLVNAIYTLLGYLNAITKAWFNLDLFAEKQNKSVKETNKEAKKLKKTLAGFDTANVLSDSSGGGGGGAGEAAKPIEFPDVEIPEWVQWIADNKDTVLKFLEGVGLALAALKLTELLNTLNLIGALPIFLILAGLAITIQGIVDFINDPSWQNFLTILEGIALIVAGIAIAMGGWIVALVALGVAIVAYVIQNWDKVKEILGKIWDWIYQNIIKPIGDGIVAMWNGIRNAFSSAWKWIQDKIINPIKDAFSKLWNGLKDGAVKAWTNIKSAFGKVGEFFSGIWNTIKQKFTDIGQKIGDAVGSAFKKAINAVLSVVDGVINTPIRAINKVLDVVNAVPGINIGKLSEIKIPRLAQGGIVNNPGKGVAMGNYIAGERGAEAVIPLTDDTLQRLANMIPINIDLTNRLDSRVISRQMVEINKRETFARNGG